MRSEVIASPCAHNSPDSGRFYLNTCSLHLQMRQMLLHNENARDVHGHLKAPRGEDHSQPMMEALAFVRWKPLWDLMLLGPGGKAEGNGRAGSLPLKVLLWFVSGLELETFGGQTMRIGP